jgi:hypothetical protein
MKFLDLFKFFTVKQELHSITGDWVDVENIEEELDITPLNYVRTYESKGVNYVVIKETERLGICSLFGIDWFDKQHYVVMTDFEFEGETVTFETKHLEAMHSQIDLQILLFAIYNSKDEYVIDEYDEYEK